MTIQRVRIRKRLAPAGYGPVRPARLRGLLALALLGVLSHSPRVRADAASEARARYDRALSFYDAGVYDAALVEFMRAEELKPSDALRYNIAQTRLAMRDYAGALAAFEGYLRAAGESVSSERLALVNARIDDLKRRVGQLVIECDVPDADVLIDDVVVGKTPLSEPLIVATGLRRLTVSHRDYPPRSVRVSIAGSEQVSVALSLRPALPELARAGQGSTPSAADAPSASAQIPLPTAPESERSRALRLNATRPNRTLAYVGTAVTGLALAGTVVLGILTLHTDANLEARRKQPNPDPAAYNAVRADMQRLAWATDGLAVATLLGAGITTWLWLRDGSERAPDSETPGQRASAGPRLTCTGAGARMSWDF